MAHCHPVLMVRSILQDLWLALVPQQAHAPDAFVLLAFTQQHPSSQHLVRKPGQSLTVLVLTEDHMCVGDSIWSTQVETSALAASAMHT